MVYRFFSFIVVFSFVFLLWGCFDADERVEVMSFNVRYDNAGDSINGWENRLPLIESYLADKKPAIIGLQEVLANQLNDLHGLLPDYHYIGVGRTDGKLQGEFCPVFYRADAFELMAKSHFWLSDTPDVPGSKSWGAHFPRVVSWLKLKNLKTGHIFFFFNAHLSHVSEEARAKGVTLLLWKINEIAGKAPVILVGDFNTVRDSQTYRNIIGNFEGFYPLWDAETLANGENSEREISYNGFGKERVGKRVDFIFVNGYFDVLSHQVDQVQEGAIYISDHYPVSAIIKFSTQMREQEGELRVPAGPGIKERKSYQSNDGLLDLRTMFF